ncbi:MAG: hypothetical protein ACREI9_11590 [Nitrospiraceae bacterium]
MLTISEPRLRASNPDAPVFGPVRFMGRAGLVKNLAGRCSSWQSVLLYGGPKLGKTSLLLQLRWVLERQQTPSWSSPAVQYLDLRDNDTSRKFFVGEWDHAQVLLLDNCESLMADPDRLADRVKSYAQRTMPSQAIVWAGDRAWYEYAKSAKAELNLLLAPLAVLLNSEARALVGPALQPPQIEAALQHGGTHPYVLKALRTQFLAAEPKAGTKALLRTAARTLVPFFESCAKAVEPSEHKLLRWLVKKGKPANPREAAKALKMSSVKAAADVLCYLGLISRWNLECGAMLQANCTLFNDWYLAARHG